MSFQEVHLHRSRPLILLMRQWMAQDQTMAVYDSPHQGWRLQSLPNPEPVLFQLCFRNFSILEFLKLNNDQHLVLQSFVILYTFTDFIVPFLSLDCIQVMFCPLSEKIFNFTYRIHAYCKRVNAEMLKKKVKDFLSPISTLVYTAPIFYISANIYLHIQMYEYMNTLGAVLHKQDYTIHIVL